MADGYDMHVGLNSLRIIFRRNLYEKSGKWIRYAWRVQNFALPMAACISKELCSNSTCDFSLAKMQLKSMRRWGKANTYRKKKKNKQRKEKRNGRNESRKLC